MKKLNTDYNKLSLFVIYEDADLDNLMITCSTTKFPYTKFSGRHSLVNMVQHYNSTHLFAGMRGSIFELEFLVQSTVERDIVFT